MTQKPVTPLCIGHNAAVTRAFPGFVAGENGVGRIFFPWPQQGTRAGDPKGILAPDATTPVAGIKQIKPVVAVENKWPLNHTAFPTGIIANQFPGFTDQLRSVVVQPLRPDWRWPVAAVSVFFPDEIPDTVYVRSRSRINRAVLLCHQRTVIGVWAGGSFGGCHRHGQRSASSAPHVINIIAPFEFGDFRRPKISRSPSGPVGEDGAD